LFGFVLYANHALLHWAVITATYVYSIHRSGIRHIIRYAFIYPVRVGGDSPTPPLYLVYWVAFVAMRCRFVVVVNSITPWLSRIRVRPYRDTLPDVDSSYYHLSRSNWDGVACMPTIPPCKGYGSRWGVCRIVIVRICLQAKNC